MIPGVGRNADLMKEIFATDAGEVGGVVDTPTASYIFRVAEKIPSYVPELSNVREKVSEQVRKQAADKLAHGRATALLERLKESRDIDALASAESLTVADTGSFGRGDNVIPNVGGQPELRTDAFTLSPEQPVAPKVYALSGDSIVAVLKERLPADEAKFAEQKETLQKQYREQRRTAVVQAFVDQLKARSAIEIQPEYLAALATNGPPGRRSQQR